MYCTSGLNSLGKRPYLGGEYSACGGQGGTVDRLEKKLEGGKKEGKSEKRREKKRDE